MHVYLLFYIEQSISFYFFELPWTKYWSFKQPTQIAALVLKWSFTNITNNLRDPMKLWVITLFENFNDPVLVQKKINFWTNRNDSYVLLVRSKLKPHHAPFWIEYQVSKILNLLTMSRFTVKENKSSLKEILG